MAKLPNIHPGDVLHEKFLIPLGMTQYRLAKHIHVPFTRIAEIVKGQRAVTSDTALRLGRLFGMTPDFWMNLQAAYDLEEARNSIAGDLDRIEPLELAAE